EARRVATKCHVRAHPAAIIQRRGVTPNALPVHEEPAAVQVGLIDARPVEEGPVDVWPEAEAKGEAEAIGRIKERIVADEWIEEERIVAGAVKAVAVAVRPAPAESHVR